MTDKEMIESLNIRVEFLETLLGELVYLAKCQGADFEHIWTKEVRERYLESVRKWKINDK